MDQNALWGLVEKMQVLLVSEFCKEFFFSGNISKELDFRLFRDCILRYFSPSMPINCYLFLWSIENNLTNL